MSMGNRPSFSRENETTVGWVFGKSLRKVGLIFHTPPRSMSSIKRDVKKKAPPRPEGEILSRDPWLLRKTQEFGVTLNWITRS